MDAQLKPSQPAPSPAIAVFRFFSSLKMATVLLLLIFVLTWLATLEQTVTGLRPMMLKYFDWKSLYFFPTIGKPFTEGAPVPITIPFPFPSGFWLCALFTLNLTLGGLVRIRKTKRKLPVILSHFSMVFLMIAAGVTHFMEERGAMSIYEGRVSDFARDYFEQTLEISEMADGKVQKVHVIDGKSLNTLHADQKRVFKMTNLPFDLEVSSYLGNAEPMQAAMGPPAGRQEAIDGFWLRPLPPVKDTELHQAGCIVQVLDKSGNAVGEKFLMSSRTYQPATLNFEGRPYLLDMRKKLWVLPYKVRLDDFRVERDPGVMRAASYESDVTRLDGETSEAVRIKMNEPMRRGGYTFFQTNWGPQDEESPSRYFTVLEVVRNPADHWPLIALIFVMAGLLWQFIWSLVLYVIQTRPKQKL